MIRSSTTSSRADTRGATRLFVLCVIGVVFLAGFNIFFRLSQAKIEEWDEARRGVAAFEMLQESSRASVHTYLGAPDYWSLKPPLGLWLIRGTYQIFGPSRFSLRLPSAISGLLCVLLVMMLGGKLFGRYGGVTAGAILATTPPFILQHSARHGEYDAPLALLVTIIAVVYSSRMSASARACAVGVALGLIFLLKSFAVFLPLGVILGARVIGGRPWWVGWRVASITSASLISVVTPWILARYQFDGTVFFGRMIEEDLIHRTLSPIEGHAKPLGYFFLRLLKRDLAWMVFGFMVVGVLVKRRMRPSRACRMSNSLIVSWVVVPLVIATLMRTKIEWYINAAYPGLALLLTLGAFRAFALEARRTALALFAACLITSEGLIIRRICLTTTPPADERLLQELSVPTGGRLYSDWSQSQRFVAIVERRLPIAHADSIHAFKELCKPGDRFIAKVTPDSEIPAGCSRDLCKETYCAFTCA